MSLRMRPFIHLSLLVSALWLTLWNGQAGGSDLSPTLRQQIIDAGMSPWNGGMVSVDEALRGQNGERVSLRQFVGKPILAYNYAQW